MKLSHLLRNVRIDVAVRLAAALQPMQSLDLALGTLAQRIIEIGRTGSARAIVQSVADALATIFSESEVKIILERLTPHASEIQKIIRAIANSSRLSDQEREDLAHEFYPKALAWASRHGVCEPSDVAAPAFLEALDHFDPDRGKFEPFLYLCLRFRRLDWIRKRSHQPAFAEMPDDYEAPCPKPAPFVDTDALDKALTEIWRDLNPVDQRLIWLRWVGNFEYREIGGQLDFIGCPLKQATLRARIQRFKARLEGLRREFPDMSGLEFVEAIHRVARATGTLTVSPSAKQVSPHRRERRRQAAKQRCQKRNEDPGSQSGV